MTALMPCFIRNPKFYALSTYLLRLLGLGRTYDKISSFRNSDGYWNQQLHIEYFIARVNYVLTSNMYQSSVMFENLDNFQFQIR